MHLLAFVFIFLSGCIARSTAESTHFAVVDLKSGPRVQKQMQSLFFEKLKDQPKGEAWALFSYGGWSDAGQIVLMIDDSSKVEVMRSKPNTRSFDSPTSLPSSDVEPLKKNTESYDKLNDKIVVAFDALEYEYVHAVNTGNQWEIKARVMMNLVNEKDGLYYELVSFFKKYTEH